jgi:hypothetical protein
MRKIISHIISRYRFGLGQFDPSKIRKREIFILDIKAAVFSLLVCSGLFFTIVGSESTEKWSQKREDEEWREFKIKPISQGKIKLDATQSENKIDSSYNKDSLNIKK